MRALLVAVVLWAFAVGRGLRANAEGPAADNQKKSQLVCSLVSDVERLQSALTGQCDSSKALTTSFVPSPPGIVHCCVQR